MNTKWLFDELNPDSTEKRIKTCIFITLFYKWVTGKEGLTQGTHKPYFKPLDY